MAQRERRIGRSLMVGLAGGLIASWTMNQFQSFYSKASEPVQEEREQPVQGESQAESEDATMKAAGKLSNIFEIPLSREEKKKAGPFVHYAFGSAMGAMYGVAAELFPNVTRGFGTGFGAVLFVIADEIAVPVLGLAGKKPSETPLSAHVSGLAAHLVYGATTESVRRAVMATL